MEAEQRTTGRSAAQKDRRRCVGADGLGGEVRAAPDEILQYLPYRDRLVAVAGLDPGRPYGKEGGERVDVVGLGQTGAVALRRFGDRDLRAVVAVDHHDRRSEEHTSELQSLMRNSYAGICLKKKTT